MSVTIVGDTKVVTTRKPHRCHGCCLDIPVKSLAQRGAYIYDGRAYTLYYCLSCVALLPLVRWNEIDDEGLQEGELIFFIPKEKADEEQQRRLRLG